MGTHKGTIAGLQQSLYMSGYDYFTPQVLNKLFRGHGDEFLPTYNVLRSMGLETSVANDVFYHYEKDDILAVIHALNTVAAGAAGAPMLITLSPSDLNAQNKYYPRLNQIITFHDEVQGRITNIDVSTPTAPILTVYPVKSANTISTVTAGDELIITSNSWAEGTGQPVGTYRGASKKTFYVQIFKETFSVTGSQMTNERFFTQYDNGQNLTGVYREGQIAMDYLMAMQIDGALWLGEEDDNTTYNADPVTGEPNKTTKGIIPTIRESGTVYPYTPTLFSMTDFDNIARKLVRQRVTTPYVLVMSGMLLNQEMENVLVNFTKNQPDAYVDEFGSALFGGGANGKELAVSVGFKGVKKSGKTFLMYQHDGFSNPSLYGATGYNFEKMGVVIPIDSIKDPKTGLKVNSIGIRYKQLGDYSRRMQVWNVNGASDNLISEIDANNSYMRAHLGLEIAMANKLILIDV